jgi:hypothetical protein
MTWKTNKRLLGLLGYEYKLLDDFAELKIISKKRLTPQEVDRLTIKIMKLNYQQGELKTEKGTIKYKYNPKIWEK